jgi:serine/threonine-protein kinase
MYKKATVLFVDDEERILRSLMSLFKGRYRVLATTDPREALEIVAREQVHVIVSDQRMPVMRGCDLLRQVKEISPRTLRLLLTGYSEMDAIISSVNEGEIFRYIAKPWTAVDITNTLDKAVSIAQGLRQIGDGLSQPDSQADPASLRLGVLVIDEDEQTFHAVRESLGDEHEVRWGTTLQQAFDLLGAHETAIVVSEVLLGQEDLTGPLKLLKQKQPDVITLVLTSFQDTSTMIGLINQGQVYRFLPKPVRKGLLGMSLRSAIKHHAALKSQPALRQRHAVESAARPDGAATPERVISYLQQRRKQREDAGSPQG